MVPSEFTGALREAYVAGYKVCPQTLRIQPAAKALNSLQSGYAAGVQVTVSVNLNSGKNLKPVEYSGGIQQVCACCSEPASLGTWFVTPAELAILCNHTC